MCRFHFVEGDHVSHNGSELLLSGDETIDVRCVVFISLRTGERSGQFRTSIADVRCVVFISLRIGERAGQFLLD